VIVKLPYGSFTYSVDHTKIVKADNQKVIHSTDKEELVMTTCYPFHYVGHAPKRYIVYAYPVED
ncbi:MAG TPA: sortase, partial [Bacillales bacterium]|nr:sortase [Bacillales bacterium]